MEGPLLLQRRSGVKGASDAIRTSMTHSHSELAPLGSAAWARPTWEGCSRSAWPGAFAKVCQSLSEHAS